MHDTEVVGHNAKFSAHTTSRMLPVTPRPIGSRASRRCGLTSAPQEDSRAIACLEASVKGSERRIRGETGQRRGGEGGGEWERMSSYGILCTWC
jgi:hypothetical protein